jgi:hypothetical protein
MKFSPARSWAIWRNGFGNKSPLASFSSAKDLGFFVFWRKISYWSFDFSAASHLVRVSGAAAGGGDVRYAKHCKGSSVANRKQGRNHVG